MFSPQKCEYYIYCLVDPITEEVRYVGVTYRPKRRLNDHLERAKKKITHRDKWVNSLLEKGVRPIMQVVAAVPREEASAAETYWIAYYRSIGAALTNHTDGGEGCVNPSEETKKKISDAQKGRKKGPLSLETREKLRKAHMGRVFSKERCQNISKAKKGKLFSEEHKKKLSESKSEPIRCIETGECFPSARRAAEQLNISYSRVCASLRFKRTTPEGLTFIKVGADTPTEVIFPNS